VGRGATGRSVVEEPSQASIGVDAGVVFERCVGLPRQGDCSTYPQLSQPRLRKEPGVRLGRQQAIPRGSDGTQMETESQTEQVDPRAEKAAVLAFDAFDAFDQTGGRRSSHRDFVARDAAPGRDAGLRIDDCLVEQRDVAGCRQDL
jgi:hypothetical protein